MEVPEFPIERTEQEQAELTAKRDQGRALRKYVGPAEGGASPVESYDSLLDYWHILFRHRVTLLTFALVALCASLLISLVQTPIYRVRTSLEIQSSGFTELKSTDSAGSSTSYASPESYVETQVKLLQSES